MLNSLQILRGFAAWLVVIHHIVQSYFMGDTKNSILLMAAQKFGSLGVDIFFVLSGVVMALVADKYVKSGMVFGINRAFRVIPVYWFYTLLLVISILIFPSGTYLTWWEGDSLLKSILFVPNINPNGYGYYPTLYVGWTLIYEMFYYFLFTLILTFRIPQPIIFCAFALALIAVLTRNINFLGHSSWLLLEFSIGMIISLILKAGTFKQNNLFLAILISSLFFLALALIGAEKHLFAKMFLCAFIVVVFISLERYFSINNRILLFLKTLGDWSYSTYLNHVVVIGWFYYFFGSNESSISDMIAIFGIVITVYFLSYLSYRHVELNTYVSGMKYKSIAMLTKSSSGR